MEEVGGLAMIAAFVVGLYFAVIGMASVLNDHTGEHRVMAEHGVVCTNDDNEEGWVLVLIPERASECNLFKKEEEVAR